MYNILFTGGFDPVHSGHIECIKHCAMVKGNLYIGLNSDEWLTRKKGRPFMSFEERKAVLTQMQGVHAVISFDDSDNTACDAIAQLLNTAPKQKVLFVNGGDRTDVNTPEMERYKDNPNVEFAFGVGGDYKKNSSSSILSDWAHPIEERVWGKFLTYYDSKKVKIKRLLIEPGSTISMQYHNKRSELWFIERGEGKLTTLVENREVSVKTLGRYQSHTVELGSWHRLENVGKRTLQVIEIQYGEECAEEDIVRLKEIL